MHVVISVNNVPIRLTSERWMHIVEARDDLAGRMDEVLDTIESPDCVTQGYRGALLAWKGYGKRGFLAVVYKELNEKDGFIVTAFFTSKLKRKNRVWP